MARKCQWSVFNYFVVVVLCAFMAIDNRGAHVTIFDVNVGK